MDDVHAGSILGEVTVRACLDGVEHRLVVRDGGEHHNLGVRPAALDLARRLGAGAIRQ